MIPPTAISSIVQTLGGGSGIDMTALATNLAAAQFAARIDRNTVQTDTVDRQISAAGTLKSELMQLASAVGERVRTGDLSVQPQIANSTVAAVSRGAISGGGTYSLEVHALAAGQVLSSPSFAAPTTAAGSGTLTLRFGSITAGNFTEDTARAAANITIASGATLSDVAGAINAARTGVSAYVLNGADGAHLMLKGASGAANAFVLEAGETMGDPGLAQLAWNPAAAPERRLSSAANAELKLDGQAISSASNTLTDVVPGLSLVLTGTNPGTSTTVRFSDPASAVNGFMADLTSALNELVTELNRDVDPLTGDLARDTGARAMRRSLSLLAGSTIIPGAARGEPATLADLGLATNRDGSFRLDPARLTATLKASPGGVAAMLTNGIHGVFASLDKLSRTTNTAGDPGTLAGSLARLSARKIKLATEATTLADAQEKLRAQMVTRFAATDTRVSASRATLSFLQNQIAAWNAPRN